MLGQLTNNQTDSLKVLASVMLYVGRRAAKSIPQILVCHRRKEKTNQYFFCSPQTLPHEWELSLYCDADIEPIIQHPEIKSIITTCEVSYLDQYIDKYFLFFDFIKLSLRVWCEEYIRRIDESFGKALRT